MLLPMAIMMGQGQIGPIKASTERLVAGYGAGPSGIQARRAVSRQVSVAVEEKEILAASIAPLGAVRMVWRLLLVDIGLRMLCWLHTTAKGQSRPENLVLGFVPYFLLLSG